MVKLKNGDFIFVVGLPRRNDGIGYNKKMQQFYKKIGTISEVDQTLNLYSDKEETYYGINFPGANDTWYFWQKNLRKLDIKPKPKKRCLACDEKIRLSLFKKKCKICNGVLCNDCKHEYYNYATRVCILCTTIKDATLEKNRGVIRENIQSNKKAEIVIITEDGEYVIPLINNYYDNVKKEYKKIMEQYKKNGPILEWKDGFMAKEMIERIFIREKGGKKREK